jgi:hypothetical protein
MQKIKVQRTLTFQPTEEVREAVLSYFKVQSLKDIPRGGKTELLNNALEAFLPQEVRKFYLRKANSVRK